MQRTNLEEEKKNTMSSFATLHRYHTLRSKNGVIISTHLSASPNTTYRRIIYICFNKHISIKVSLHISAFSFCLFYAQMHFFIKCTRLEITNQVPCKKMHKQLMGANDYKCLLSYFYNHTSPYRKVVTKLCKA